jgi:hypothetical protein
MDFLRAAAFFTPEATPPAPDPDILDPSLWEIAGYRNTRVTITRPGVPLLLTQTGLAATQVGMKLIGVSQTDVYVRAVITITGWDSADGDTFCAGPACRLTGTNGVQDWSGYSLIQRMQSATSRRARPRKYTAGTAASFGTETTGLPASWVDGSTKIEMELEADGTSIITRARVLGAPTWAHQDLTASDSGITAAGGLGIFCNELEVGMAVNVYEFGWTAL